MNLSGQWIGTYEAEARGTVIVNLERHGELLAGSLSLIETSHPTVPAGIYRINASENNGSVTGEAQIAGAMTKDMMTLTTVEAVAEKASIQVPRRIDFCGQAGNDHMELGWSTDLGTSGKARVRCSDSGGPSSIAAVPVDWDQFRKEVRSVRPLSRLFRGQERHWPLRTRFHRSGRSNLIDFPAQVTPRLQALVSTVTSFVFPTSDPVWNAALLALAQHHGYPTPLLDWTWSPYVAAYFACHKCIEDRTIQPRILVFDCQAWERSDLPPALINTPYPTLRVIEPVPLHNPRVMPQQSVVMLTNVYDVESYLASKGELAHMQYLRALDLTDDPRDIMIDLRMMGISAAALFPGLDGVCRGLYETEETLARSSY